MTNEDKNYRQWYYDGAWHDAPKPKISEVQFEALKLLPAEWDFVQTMESVRRYEREFFRNDCSCTCSLVKSHDRNQP